MGLRLRWLGSDRLTIRDLLVIVRECSSLSPIARWSDPDAFGWGVQEYILAAVFDVLQGANWQRGGGRGTPPQSLPRPGMRDGRSSRRQNGGLDELPMGANESGVFMGEATPLNELMEWLGWK